MSRWFSLACSNLCFPSCKAVTPRKSTLPTHNHQPSPFRSMKADAVSPQGHSGTHRGWAGGTQPLLLTQGWRRGCKKTTEKKKPLAEVAMPSPHRSARQGRQTAPRRRLRKAEDGDGRAGARRSLPPSLLPPARGGCCRQSCLRQCCLSDTHRGPALPLPHPPAAPVEGFFFFFNSLFPFFFFFLNETPYWHLFIYLFIFMIPLVKPGPLARLRFFCARGFPSSLPLPPSYFKK